MRRFLALLAILALVAAACGSSTSTSSTSTTTTDPVTSSTSSGSTTTTDTATPPTSSDSTTTSTEPEGISNPELQAAIDELVVITEEIRGLEFTEDPKVVFVTEDELDQRLLDDLEEEFEPEELARDQATYVLLGILEEGRDLRQLYLDLYADVVAGFYDPEERELVVPVTDGALTGAQRRTLVHELTHALTDQEFDFGGLGEQLADEERYEEALALRGVVEGDASITEALYLQTLSPADQRDALSSGGDPNALAGVPRYIQELLFFPYTAGVEFMVDVWQGGGFPAVNATYRNPPVTTEQVLDPDAYRRGEAGAVVMVEELAFDGYELGEEGVWGETGLGAMLGQNLGSRLVLDAADGWGGDWYQIYFDGENVLFVFSYVGDTEDDAEELVRAIDAYNDAAIAADDFHFVEQTGDRVLWILADDPAIGALAQQRLAG